MEDCPSRNNHTGGQWSSDTLRYMVPKALLLTLLLIVVVSANVAVILRVTHRSRKWMALENVIKTLAALGIANGIMNVSIYIITTCTGHWVLGGTLCQIHGVFGSVIINSWVWILTIAAFERYVKLLAPSDHASFFSEVNTKIMVWGCILLLFVIYLGPVYGWGEYSFLRGKIDLTLQLVFNISESTEEVAKSRQATFTFFQTMLRNPSSPTSSQTIDHLVTFFEKTHNLELRRPHLSEKGLVLPMRAPTREALQCLWHEFEAGHLVTEVRSMVEVNVTGMESYGGVYEVSVGMEKEEYTLYSQVHMPYQEGATCSLDYSDVNKHVYSFVGFAGFVNLVLPAVFMAYCYIRIFHAGLQKICMFSRDGISPEDGIWTRVLAYTGFSSLICHIPFTLCSLCSGRGVYVPTLVHFSATVVLYLSTCLLACFYLCATKISTGGYDDTRCSCLGRRNMNVFGEIHQRLLSRPNSATNSPYRPNKNISPSVILKTSSVNETQV